MEDLWVFDNDGTLYDDTPSLAQFKKILAAYLAPILGRAAEDIDAEIVRIKKLHRTQSSVVALMKEYGLDYETLVLKTFLAINLEQSGIPTPDIERRRVLQGLRGRKVVFTNNPSAYARKSLSYIGLGDCFDDVIGMEETNFTAKPDDHAYQCVQNRHIGAQRIFFVDDVLENLDTARARGWITFWYNPKDVSNPSPFNHIRICSFRDLSRFHV